MKFTLVLLLVFSSSLFATENSPPHSMGPATCGDMEVWDYSMAMCMPLAMAGMPMTMLMLKENAFFVQAFVEKPRGRNAFSSPNMVMADLGTSIGDHHYLNLDVMGTAERWTVPHDGVPELLQIGEEQADGSPFIDAQHPHSSPLMGLTLSDTISFGNEKDHMKIWFSPRGQTTDGPVPFMHRPTGVMNPETPLGHHVGQDVGHISSTVAGASVHLWRSTLEVSAFNGEEPEPTKVNLPMGPLNSYAGRLIQQFTSHGYGMVSAAYVKAPEHDDSTLDHIWRYSASYYRDRELLNGWMLHTALVWGLTNGYDHASALNSFLHEILLHKEMRSLWTRLEILQRTPHQLEIDAVNPNQSHWVGALTLGYTHTLKRAQDWEINLGGSVSKDFLPAVYRDVYGEAWSGRVFLQVSGMQMWNL